MVGLKTVTYGNIAPKMVYPRELGTQKKKKKVGTLRAPLRPSAVPKDCPQNWYGCSQIIPDLGG